MLKSAARNSPFSSFSASPFLSGWAALLACSACLFLAVVGLAQRPSTRGPLAIKNVNVIDGLTPRVQTDRTVLIEGDRIKAIGGPREVRIPAGAKIINGEGRFLIA